MKKVDKPWGYELIWANTDRYVGKILHIEEGKKLSLQYHEKKTETVYVQSGELQLITASYIDGSIEDEQKYILQPGQKFHIPAGLVHRMIAIKECDIFEVSTPELDDIIRIEDEYGRA
jgi:mannose-6-phosphate isomerase